MLFHFMTIFHSLVPRMVENVDYELLIIDNNIEVTINITKVKQFQFIKLPDQLTCNIHVLSMATFLIFFILSFK